MRLPQHQLVLSGAAPDSLRQAGVPWRDLAIGPGRTQPEHLQRVDADDEFWVARHGAVVLADEGAYRRGAIVKHDSLLVHAEQPNGGLLPTVLFQALQPLM